MNAYQKDPQLQADVHYIANAVRRRRTAFWLILLILLAPGIALTLFSIPVLILQSLSKLFGG